jgi:hypothetical protein
MPVRKKLTVPLAFSLAALAVAGCNVVPSKAYEGPSRPEQELSVLRGGAFGEELSYVSLVDLRVIDGVAQRARMYLASVLPGRHAVGLSETLSAGRATLTQYCAVELDTLAGCLYVLRPPSPPYEARSGRSANWEWNVDMLIAAECQSGGFQTRASARCGSSASIFERPSR